MMHRHAYPLLARFLRLILLAAFLCSSFLPAPGLAQSGEPPQADLPQVGLKSLSTEDPAPAITSSMDHLDAWVVRLYYRDRADLDAIAGELDIWEVNRKENYVVAALRPTTYARLLEQGYRMEFDAEKMAWLAPNAPLDGRYYYFDAHYSNPNGLYMVDFLQDTHSNYPALTELFDIGNAWQGEHGGYNRDIWVLRITNEDAAFGDIADKPAFFLFSTIHAREVATPELAIRYIKYLTDGFEGQGGYGNDPDVTWLVDYNVVYVLVSQNPDGHRVNEADVSANRRKNMDNDDGCTYASSWGVDLNRNSSFFWGCCGGSSGDACNDTYRGPSAASEPETQAFQNFFATVMPDHNGPNGDTEMPPAAPADAAGIFISLHSYSDLVLWPWDMSPAPANAAQLQTVGRKLAFFNGYDPSGAIGYTVDGATDDWTYGKFGVASFTFEVGASGGTCGGFFPAYDCIDGINAANRDFWAENGPSFVYAHKIARAPYMLAYGPEALNVSATPGMIDPGDPVILTATLNDTRYNNQSGTEPTQNIAAAEYYLEIPPWQPGAVAVPMAAADGSFDSKIEAVTASLDTSGMAGGKRLIYVRGQDAAGNWGPVSAVFLTTWSGNEGAVSGTLTDAVSGEPLAGTVYVDAVGLSADSDPVSGVYSLTLPAGTWSLRASAALHLEQSVHNVSVSDGNLTSQDFQLQPTAGMIVAPLEVEAILNLGDIRQKTVRISNPGNADLIFNTSESEIGFTPLLASASILLVDDDDNTPDVRNYYTSALDALGYSYTVFDVGGGAGNGPTAAIMAGYDLVIWFSGDQYGSGADEGGPNAADELALASYLDGGGAFFLSSQEYYYDRGQTTFLTNYLGVSSMTSDNGDYSSVTGQGHFSGLGPYSLNYGPISDYSDSLTPGTGSLAFQGNNGRNAAAYTEQSMFFAFPWEAIYNSNAANGQAVLLAILDYLIGDIAWLGVEPAAGTVPAQDSLDLTLTFSGTEVLQNGIYSGTLNIRGNAPDSPLQEVLVRMLVGDFSPAELVTTKDVNAGSVHPGDLITYTFSHQLVLSDTHAYTQAVLDALPAQVSVLTSTIQLDGAPAAALYDPIQHVISYTLSGAFTDSLLTEVIFQAQVNTDVLSGTLVINTLEVTAEVDGEQVAPPDQPLASFTVLDRLSEANLLVSKQVSAGEITAGDTLTYTLAYQLALTGPHTFTITLQDGIPDGLAVLTPTLTLNALPAPGLYDPLTDAISATLSGNFTDQHWISITFQAQVGAEVPAGTQIINQTVADAWVDDLPVRPLGRASAAINVLAPPIEYAIWKQASLEQVQGGEVFTYTLSQRLALAGTHAFDQSLYDALPAQVSIRADSIRLNGVPAPELYNAGANALDGSWSGIFTDERWITVTYQVQALTNVISGTQAVNTHQGSATLDGVHPAGQLQAQETVVILGPPIVLEQSKASSTAVVLTGEVFTYTLQQHLALAGAHTFELNLVDYIPHGLTVLPETVKLNGVDAPYLYLPATNRIKGKFTGSFVDEYSVNVTFQVRVDTDVISGTLIQNTLTGNVKVDSVHILTAPDASAAVLVYQAPQLSLAKTSSLAQAYAGQVFTYTLQAGLALDGVNDYRLQLHDPLPDGLWILTETLRLDGAPAPELYDLGTHAIRVTLDGNFTNSADIEITYQVQVAHGTGAGQVLTNTLHGSALVSGLAAPQPDPASVVVTTIAPPAVFDLGLSSNVSVAYPGQLIQYSLNASLLLDRVQLSARDARIAWPAGGHQYTLDLIDPLPEGVEMILSSLRLNGVPTPALYNAAQRQVEYHAAGALDEIQVVTITFQVRVDQALTPGAEIINQLQATASLNGVQIPAGGQSSLVIPVEAAPYHSIFLPLLQQ